MFTAIYNNPKFNGLDNSLPSAIETLKTLGFEYKGGLLWQPPLGKAPYYLKDVPKYVTFNAEEDQMGLWSTFTHNKDYKVLNVYETGYIIENDLGTQVKIAKTFFYPEPSRDELLPSKVGVEEEESSFDNLVRSDYIIQEGDYFILNKLSEEQKVFLQNTFKTITNVSFLRDDHNYVFWDNVDCGTFVGVPYDQGSLSKKITFNDLFVETTS